MKVYKIVAIVVAIAVGFVTLSSLDFGNGDTQLSAASGSLMASSEYVKPGVDVVAGSNSFGIELLKNSYNSNENVVVSPTSLYLAFAMLYNGASEETQRQMYDAMNITTDIETFNKEIKSLQQSLLAPRKDTLVNIANSIWLKDSFKELVKLSFIKNNEEYFGALIEVCDFSDPNTVKTINNWVKKNTNGLIDTVMDKIDPSMVMYLINTIYLKANWQIPFYTDSTIKEDFYAPSGIVQVDTMNNVGFYQFYKGDGVKAIKLPYTDGRSHMLVVLPEGNMDNFMSGLDAELIGKLDSSTKSTKVRLALPKVNVSTELHPVKQLQTMGMIDMFDSRADFSNISDSAKELGLCVSDVTHKTVLKIDEQGTEAAAVTSIGMTTTSVITEQEDMIVDRPFFVAIIDDEAGIIFAGVVVNPSSQN